MSAKIEIHDNFALLPGANTLVTFTGKDDASKPANAKPLEIGSNEWSPWGDSNTWPADVMDDINDNSIAMRAFNERKKAHYGKGVVSYKVEIDENGNEKKIIVRDNKQINDFFRENRVQLKQLNLILNLEILGNAYPEFILNKAKNKINRFNVLDTSYCRLKMMDKKSFKISTLYYSAQWPTPNDSIQEIPIYDPDKKNDKGQYADKKFIYPLNYGSIGQSYYHMPVWHGVRESGWLAIANKVPVMKKAIMENQMTIKYHVKIPWDYFDKRYPSPDYTKDTREAKVQEKLQELNTFLSDVANAGKSLVSFLHYDKATLKPFPGWEIEVIDNKLKDDAYLPDSAAANSEILFAIGVDPCLIGAGIPGGKLGAGSGSDKREAYWKLVNSMHADRQVTLESLYFIRDFNGWGDDIEFGYVDVETSQTMDQHPSKKKEVMT